MIKIIPKNNIFHFVRSTRKLDGVGPVDNRLSTDFVIFFVKVEQDFYIYFFINKVLKKIF